MKQKKAQNCTGNKIVICCYEINILCSETFLVEHVHDNYCMINHTSLIHEIVPSWTSETPPYFIVCHGFGTWYLVLGDNF